MSNRYFLDGGINDKDTVFLYFANKDGEFVLIRSNLGINGTSYLASQTTIDSTGKIDNSFIPTFRLEVQSYSTKITEPVTYKLVDTTLSYLGVNSEGVLVNTRTSRVSSSTFSSTQTKYQPWRKPTAFLAGDSYSFISDEGKVLIPLLSNDGYLDTSSCQLYIVPTIWYKQGFCSKPDSSTDSLIYTYCFISGNVDNKCSSIPYGWTNKEDCNLSLPYNYCTAGVNCSSQCMGPCDKNSDSCQWNYKQEAFQCNFSLSNVFSGAWWKSTWVIITLSLLAGLCLIFIIILPIIRLRNKDKKVGEVFYEEGIGVEQIKSIT